MEINVKKWTRDVQTWRGMVKRILERAKSAELLKLFFTREKL